MEFFKEEYITITIPEGVGQTHVEWYGMPSPEQYKQGSDKILEAIHQHGTSTLLMNYYELAAYLDLEVQVWTINVWFPQVMQLGINKLGVLIPAKIMSQMVVKSIYAGLPAHNIEISFFEVEEDLNNWANIGLESEAVQTSSYQYGSSYGTSSAPVASPPSSPPPASQPQSPPPPHQEQAPESTQNVPPPPPPYTPPQNVPPPPPPYNPSGNQ